MPLEDRQGDLRLAMLTSWSEGCPLLHWQDVLSCHDCHQKATAVMRQESVCDRWLAFSAQVPLALSRQHPMA